MSLVLPTFSQLTWPGVGDIDDCWVVQQLVTLPTLAAPVRGDDGQVREESFHVVLGFAPSQYGLGVLARASQQRVVNVAQRGGMCSVAVGTPPPGVDD